MATEYTPKDPEIARLFARYKKALETARELKPQVREAAKKELLGEVSVGQLAGATGETPEVFRRIAREIGVEHKRPPTVGKLAQKPKDKE